MRSQIGFSIVMVIALTGLGHAAEGDKLVKPQAIPNPPAQTVTSGGRMECVTKITCTLTIKHTDGKDLKISGMNGDEVNVIVTTLTTGKPFTIQYTNQDIVNSGGANFYTAKYKMFAVDTRH